MILQQSHFLNGILGHCRCPTYPPCIIRILHTIAKSATSSYLAVRYTQSVGKQSSKFSRCEFFAIDSSQYGIVCILIFKRSPPSAFVILTLSAMKHCQEVAKPTHDNRMQLLFSCMIRTSTVCLEYGHCLIQLSNQGSFSKVSQCCHNSSCTINSK